MIWKLKKYEKIKKIEQDRERFERMLEKIYPSLIKLKRKIDLDEFHKEIYGAKPGNKPREEE